MGHSSTLTVAKVNTNEKFHASSQNLTHLTKKTVLAEHLKKAEIPEVYGLASRVIELLKQRIGYSSLSIASIAFELHVSTRTLQRRLSEQSLSFSELRDQVRHYYGIHAVLQDWYNIDDIYILLGFSDKSSLAIAFRRWTGSTPRAFGRMYKNEYNSFTFAKV